MVGRHDDQDNEAGYHNEETGDVVHVPREGDQEQGCPYQLLPPQ